MKRTVNRRLFLRGAGSVLIGLPLLEEFTGSSVQAQASAVPTRVLTMSFGLGISTTLQAEGALGPLAPLLKFASKSAFFSNLENTSLAGEGGGSAHFRVGATQFTGVKQPNTQQAGGPSLEQIFRKHLHPLGAPTIGSVASKSAGIWSRTGSITQYVRHWNEDGSPGEIPLRRPSAVFQDLFGSLKPQDAMPPAPPSPDPNLAVQRKLDVSVLDSVKTEYDTLRGPRSFLGAESKARIDSHLTAIREVETQLLGGDQVAAMFEPLECKLPNVAHYPDPAGVTFYDAPSGSVGGPAVPWLDAQQAFRMTGDLFTLAMSCDALRFGSLLFGGAGEELRFLGNYVSPVGTRDFTGDTIGGSQHDHIFHNYDEEGVRVYQHYVVSQLAYVLEKMDSIIEPNQKTLLDNTLVLIGTEIGLKHEGSQGIFHAVVGGDGKFKPGQNDENLSFADVYATVLQAYGIPSTIQGREITSLLA
ncbi:MAG: hypothetical protein RJA70_126 [Pseudomonadota bacterium]|jgi:hypothetical protein